MTTEYADVHLTRLCGCNYKQPIQRKGNSIVVTDPQIPERRYRLRADLFDAGQRQFRDSWCIERWTERSALRMEADVRIAVRRYLDGLDGS